MARRLIWLIPVLLVLVSACASETPRQAAPTQAAAQPQPQAAIQPKPPAAAPTQAVAPTQAAAQSQPTAQPKPQPAATTAPPAKAGGGGTLVLAFEADPDTLDPPHTTGVDGLRPARWIHENLIAEDLTKGGTSAPPIVPELATSWTVSPDGLVYTFKLRQGVKFQDGTPFDAEAVKVNLDRALTKEFPLYSQLAASRVGPRGFNMIKTAEVVDPMTIRLTLKDISAAFLRNLADPIAGIVSPAALKKWGNDKLGDNPSGTGPYRLVERIRGDRVVLEPNPDYWGQKARLDRIVVKPVLEPAARITALLNGEVDVVFTLNPDDIDRLKTNPKVSVHYTDSPNIWLWQMNCYATPNQDKRVRQAISLAINRQAIANDLLRGTAMPLSDIFPPGNPAYNPNLKPAYDPEKAKKLLAEAGYPNGVKLNVMLPNSGAGMIMPLQMGELMQAQLRTVGIDINFQIHDWAPYLDIWRKGIPENISVMPNSFASGMNDPFGIERALMSTSAPPNGINAGKYQNPEIDKVLQEARKATDESKRIALYQKVAQLAAEDQPLVVIFSNRKPLAVSSKVKDFVAAPSPHVDLKRVWMEK